VIPAYPAFVDREPPWSHMVAHAYFDLMMLLRVRVGPESLKTLEELEKLTGEKV
jgi:hypothetical protein